MIELTPDQVRAIAGAAGLPLDGPDLAEVTHRLNAFVEVLGGQSRVIGESVDL
jgi:hypothetical protein